jgi:hypothetical protein
MKKTLLILTVFTLAIISCKKDEKNIAVATPIDGRNAISSSFQRTQSCAQALHDGDFTSFLTSAFGPQENKEIDWEFVSELLELFEDTYINGELYEEKRINFAQYAGIYTWNSGQNNFTRTPSSSIFRINLPSKGDVPQVLDLSMQIENFNEIESRFDGVTYFVPNSINAHVLWKEKVIFRWEVNNLTLNQSGSSTLPVSFQSEIQTPPYTHTINLSRNNSRKYTLNYSLAANGGCLYEINLTATSNIDTYEEFVLENNLLLVNGSVVFPEITYVFNANMAEIFTQEEPTASQINRYASADIMSNTGVKLAELSAVTRDGDLKVDIVYSDNTRENFEERIEEEIALLGNIFEDVFE